MGDRGRDDSCRRGVDVVNLIVNWAKVDPKWKALSASPGGLSGPEQNK